MSSYNYHGNNQKSSSYRKKPRVPAGNPPERLCEDGIFNDLILSEEQMKFRDAIYDPEKKIVFCNSAAGTGKSVIAIGTAIIMYQYGLYDGITYIVAPYAEAKMGFLPGTVEEKISAYLEPLKQAVLESGESPMHTIIQESPVTQFKGDCPEPYINAISHNYLRGQTLSRNIVIIEEAQNQTEFDLRKSLSRVKDDCKVIVIGHTRQVDLDNPGCSGFERCIEHFRSKNDDRVAICTLTTNYRGFVSRVADEAWE